MTPHVPRLAEWLLTRLAPPGAADVIAGDLDEQFQSVAASRGSLAARLWYWREAVVAIVLCRLRLRRTSVPELEGDRIMVQLLRDLKYGVRTLSRRGAFTAGAVGAIALGLGLITAVFSVTDAVLLRPLPYAGASRLVTLQQTNADNPDDTRVSPATYLDWRDASRTLAATAAVRPWSYTYAASADPALLPAGLVSEGFFELLGVRPMLGRTFLPEDYRPGAARVAVISHRLFQRQFGGDPAIVGRPLPFDDAGPLTIVGVLDPEFRWLDQAQVMWGPYPMPASLRQQRAANFLRVVGRLRDDASLEQVGAEARVLARQPADAQPRVDQRVDLFVVPIDEALVGRARTSILILFAAVALVALIAGANVGSLLLARAAERRFEFSIRVAIGAGPEHLARQLLAEAAVLTMAGTALGLLLAAAILRWVVTAAPGPVPRLDLAALNWRVYLFAAGAGALLTFLVSAVPMLHLRRTDPSALRSQTVSRGSGVRLREVLVAAEVALAVLLLIGAGLLAHSFFRVTQVDPGFDPANVAVLETHVWSAFPGPEQQARFVGDALAAVRRVPGVAAAGAVTALPFLGSGSIEMEAAVSGPSVRRAGAGGAAPAWLTIASDGYFEAMGMRIRAGRGFTDRDRAGTLPVAVVSEGFVTRFLDGDPIGATVIAANRRTPVPLAIVGVVNDLRHTGLENPGREEIFIPFAQSPFGSVSFVARTRGAAPADVIPPLKDAIRRLSRAQTFPTAATLDRMVDATMVPRRFYLVLAGTLAACALFLAAVGLYSLIAFVTVQRTREFGVRMALGGGRRDILRLVIGQGMIAPGGGLLTGALAAAIAARVLETYLFGVTPADPLTFAVVAAFVLLLALTAACLPALRAVRVDPTIALRHE